MSMPSIDKTPHNKIQAISTIQHETLKYGSRAFQLNLGTVFRRVRKISKGTFTFVMSVHLSVRMEQLGSHWTNFDET
jgi:hypothetical protein